MGKLQEAPLVRNDASLLPKFVVEFSSLKLVMADGRSNVSPAYTSGKRTPGTRDLAPRGLPVSLIDSGNPSVSIPASSINLLAQALGTTFTERDGLGPINCRLASKESMLLFGFNQNKAKIKVPLDMLVVPSAFNHRPGCRLAIDASAEIASLGAPFLQAAYVVFDIEQRRLLFAQAVMNSTHSDVEEFLS